MGIIKYTAQSAGWVNQFGKFNFVSVLGNGISDGQLIMAGKWVTVRDSLVYHAKQTALAEVANYGKWLKHWEISNINKLRKQHIKEHGGPYGPNRDFTTLIENSVPVEQKEVIYTDSIVGEEAPDYLELSQYIEPLESSGDAPNVGGAQVSGASGASVSAKRNELKFVDLSPTVRVSTKNNIVLTTVTGRDGSRKEFVSGGDFVVSISGKITSKYIENYPEAEVSKFLKMAQYKGVLNCKNTILNQFNIKQLIVTDYEMGTNEEFRNIQSYSMSCVAVEPEPIVIKTAEQEKVETAIKNDKRGKLSLLKVIRTATSVVNPSDLLNNYITKNDEK